MSDQKIVKIVLAADGTIDATKSTVNSSSFGDSVKQRVPFFRTSDTAIVNESSLNKYGAETLVTGALLVAGEYAKPVERVKKMIAHGE